MCAPSSKGLGFPAVPAGRFQHLRHGQQEADSPIMDHCHRIPALVLYTPAWELDVGLSPPLSVLRASCLKQITCVCIISKPEFMSPSEVYNPDPFYPLASLDRRGRIGHGPDLVTHTTILVASLLFSQGMLPL